MSVCDYNGPATYWLCAILYSLPILVILVLRRPHPYGKFGPAPVPAFTVHGGVGFALQESPSWIVAILTLWTLSDRTPLRDYTIPTVFIVHYINRSLIYGLSIRARTSRSQLTLAVGAMGFTSLHGLFQAYFSLCFPPTWSLLNSVGLLLMCIGEAVNVHSDRILLALKAKHESYQIPQGGLFKYVSSANFTGEIIAFFGYALAGDNFAAWIFCGFTIVVLAHRGYHTHRFYLEKFDDYPQDRKAIFPCVL